jgi:hypothetical protein
VPVLYICALKIKEKLNIGILEICVKEHYMVVNAVVKTYASDPANKIFIFTTEGARALISAQDNDGPQIEYVIFDPSKSVEDFFKLIKQYPLDRIHYTTVTKYFKAFYFFKPNANCKVFFHFHNIDLWYNSALIIQVKRLYKVFFKDKNKIDFMRQIKYSVKDVLWDFYRKKFIKKIANDGTNIIILSEAQRFHLQKYLNAKNATVFPTLIFEPDFYQDLAGSDNKIRVCIPGSVTQIRREYHKLFDVLEANIEFYKSNFIFDLLGFIPPSETALIDRIKVMQERGLNVLSYNYFIDVKQFDLELYKSDLILSNILLDDALSLQNKETAAVFHMIRGAKPGIFPESFTLDADFKDSVVKFNAYSDLHALFVDLLNNPEMIKELKANAMKISLQYSPAELIKRLI